MTGPRRKQPFAVDFARRSTKGALSQLGEEVILLGAYHVLEADNTEQTQLRCSCYNDAYQSVEYLDCPLCYGTSYTGGVKSAYRVWAQFSDQSHAEDIDRRGIWNPDKRQIQTEWFPMLQQRDWVVRVNGWTLDHRPISVKAIYRIGEVQPDSMRTGQGLGQTYDDTIGQKGTVEDLDVTVPIYRFPIVGKVFARPDGKEF